MSILNLNTPQGRGPVGKKSAKIWMGVGLLAAVLGFGSTFAANITLNSNTSPTEFGQGVQRTVYCGGVSTTLTVKPTSAFKTSANAFTVGGISITGIPAVCKSLNFVISVYNDSSDLPQTIASVTSPSASLITPTVYWTDTTTAYVVNLSSADDRKNSSACQSKKSSGTASAGGALLSLSSTAYVDPCRLAYLSSVTPSTGSGSNGAFTITLKQTATIMSLSEFDKIAIETQSDAFGLNSTSGSGAYGLVNSSSSS
jgi:hypothetical protein